MSKSASSPAVPFSGFSAESGSKGAPLFRFGVIADPQYADADPFVELNRYYRASLDKLVAAIEELNRHDLKFVVTLGDIIDRDLASFDRIMPLYERLRHPRAFLLGNHDFSVAPEHLAIVPSALGLERSYYAFSGGGYRFVVLDGNEVSVFAPPEGHPYRALAEERLAALKATGAIHAQPWNGSLSDAQFAWLAETLTSAAAAGEKVIVLGHYPVYPANWLNMWDSDRIVELLTASDNVVAYFCGHNHDGNFGEIGGKYFVNFCGMVDTPDQSCFAVVDVFDDRIEITGFGREPSRTLALRR